MDDYLNGLVRKSKETETASETKIMEDTPATNEEVHNETAGVESVETKGDSASSEISKELSAEPVETKGEDKPAPAVETKSSPKTNNGKKGHKDGDVITVANIRIYNTPDTNQPSRSVSGNIIYHNELNGWAVVDYMRPGFGLVKGFTQDIK